MEWLVQIGDSCLETLKWLAPLAVVFAVLARLMPCNRGMYWWTDLRAAGTDLLYWFVAPLFVRICQTLMLTAGIALLFDGGTPGFRAVRELPFWGQCVGVRLVQDLMLYWIHRGFHTRVGWSFHSVHHSPKVLDWLSASRFHLVNHLLSFVLADVVLLLLGFSFEVLIAFIPFNMVYSTMVHANLNWTFGPLRFVFASPVFHRWHHAEEEAGSGKNFAPTFPFLDLVFGTFHMPSGRLPERFGNGAEDFPEDFWGQLIYPFWPKGEATPRAAESAKSPSPRKAA